MTFSNPDERYRAGNKKTKIKIKIQFRNVYFAPFIEVNIDCIGDARYKPL